jgi:hypothetical protein
MTSIAFGPWWAQSARASISWAAISSVARPDCSACLDRFVGGGHRRRSLPEAEARERQDTEDRRLDEQPDVTLSRDCQAVGRVTLRGGPLPLQVVADRACD